MEKLIARLLSNQDCPFCYQCLEMDCLDCLNTHTSKEEDNNDKSKEIEETRSA